LGCIQAPRTSTQAETATNDGNGSVTTIKCGATPNLAPGEVLALQSRSLLYVSLESSHSETKEED